MTRQSSAKQFSELQRITGLRRGTAIHDKGQERVNEILEAAANLYALEGYAKFSVRQVAALVGIGIRNVQYYFPTKRVLLLATIQYGFRVFDEEVDDFMQNSGHSPRDRYLAFVDYLLESIRQPRVRGFLLQTWSVAAGNKEVASIMEKAYESYRKQFGRTHATPEPGVGRGRADSTCIDPSGHHRWNDAGHWTERSHPS